MEPTPFKKRITGRALQEMRRVHFEARPFCIRCRELRGITTPAVELDHIIPFSKGGADTLDPFENRQGLCSQCNAEKRDEDFGYITRSGCNILGHPTDPNHPWNRRR